MANAPAVLFAAASKNMNPTVLLAQIDAGTDKDMKGLAGDMSALLGRYGGDYTKALAAFRMGTDAFDRILQLHGATWEANLPEQATKYVETVLTQAGMVPSTEPAPPEAAKPTQPAESGLPFFRGLPWQEQESLVTEAAQLLHSRVSMAEAAKREDKRQRKENQDGVMDSMLKRIVDPKTNGALSERDILGDNTLEWNQKQHLIDYRRARSRELQAEGESRTNPGEVRRLMLAIHAADDDPTKTYNVAPIMDSYRAGRISTPEMLSLRREVEQMKDGNGSSFAKRAQMARESAWAGFTKSIEGSVNPAKAVSAWYAFAVDMDNQIAARRSKNEDPSPLLDPASREYLLKPERLKGFMVSGREALADAADRIRTDSVKGMPTYQDYETLSPGTQFTDPQGNIRVKMAPASKPK